MPLLEESKVLPFRVIQGSKPAAEPEVAEPATEGTEDLAAICEAAAAHVRDGDYDGVFIIFRERREEPNAGGTVDVMYSTTTDPEKAWMLDKAKQWLMTEEDEE